MSLPVPARAESARPGWFRRFWLVGSLLVAGLLLFLHGWSLERTWIQPSQEPAPTGVAGQTQWGGTLPEFAAPPRIFLDNDCYYWIRYAQEMAATGAFRIRHTDLDNVPDGRAVHWSASCSWLLLACGWLESLVTGNPLAASIESAALWANIAFFLLVLLGVGLVVRRSLGAWPSAVMVVLMAALPGLQWAFGYGRPGHHGFHSLAAIGGLLCVVLGGAGWVRTGPTAGPAAPPDREAARRWFVVGGFFAGYGMWIGATLQLVVFGSIGLAAVAATLMARPRADAAWDGTLWRRWGMAGALTSLGFYALEYMPGPIQPRLEVNHPLYAMVLLAGGEFLARLAVWREGRARRLDWLAGGVAVLGLLAVPAALLLGPPEWHALRDPYMRRLHDSIMNFQPFITGANWGVLMKALREFALLPLLLPAGAWVLWRRRHDGPFAAPLLVALTAALVLGGWTLHQVRWSNLFSPALAVLFLVLWRGAVASPGRWIRWTGLALPWLAVVPLAGFLSWGSVEAGRQARSRQLDPYLAWSIASRDVAFNLKRLAQLGPVRVMSGPGQTPSLHFFGGVAGMGSLYWENIAGVRAAADFFASENDAEAEQIVRARGVTHVVVQQDPTLADQMHWVKHGIPSSETLKKTLAWRLADPLSRPPRWLEPVPYYGSPLASQFQMRIYRVRPAGFSSGANYP